MDNKDKIILHLCAKAGSDSKKYRDNGYDVRLITIKKDVRLYLPPKNVYGIIANPPCTDLAGSGARYWQEKGIERLFEALAIVDACMRIILISNPVFWVLENPVGRLIHYLGKPKMYYQPCEYGDPYTKKTCLWGKFNIPKKNPVKPTEGSKIHLMGPSKDRQELRSIAPSGFVNAFYGANK